MADSFNWAGLMGAAQKSHNDPLYGALLGAQGAGNSQAAMGFLNNKQMNPMTGDFGQGNRPGFQSSNPNYINPNSWGTPTAGSNAPPGTITPGAAPTGTDNLQDFLKSDWTKTVPFWSSGADTSSAISTAGDALTQALKSGLARGQITQTGYDAGMKNYDTDMTNAQSWAKSFLGGQDTNEEQNIMGITKAAQAAKGSPGYDWSQYLQQINDVANQAQTALPSALKSGLGSNGFFAVAPAITAAGVAQGAFNAPESDALLKALMSQTGGKGGGTATRQLGNTGAF